MSDAPAPVVVRDATDVDVDLLAAAVSGQPLLARYGVGPEALARSLRGALGRGEDLLLAETPARALLGMAWFLRDGTFALGGYLRLIALVPGAEGRGIGARLLDEVERRTRAKSRFLFLLVSAHNDGARRFYAARGYEHAGVLPHLVRPDIDEVILWKRLAE